MAGQSVVRASGQLWKFILANTGMVVGSFAPIWPATGLDWTSGTVVAVAGYAFGCLAIRCPSCSSRWFWQAALRPELYKPIFQSSACPDCHHDCSSGTTSRAPAQP